MMELLATVLGVGFVALVMLSLCRAAGAGGRDGAARLAGVLR